MSECLLHWDTPRAQAGACQPLRGPGVSATQPERCPSCPRVLCCVHPAASPQLTFRTAADTKGLGLKVRPASHLRLLSAFARPVCSRGSSHSQPPWAQPSVRLSILPPDKMTCHRTHLINAPVQGRVGLFRRPRQQSTCGSTVTRRGLLGSGGTQAWPSRRLRREMLTLASAELTAERLGQGNEIFCNFPFYCMNRNFP